MPGRPFLFVPQEKEFLSQPGLANAGLDWQCSHWGIHYIWFIVNETFDRRSIQIEWHKSSFNLQVLLTYGSANQSKTMSLRLVCGNFLLSFLDTQVSLAPTQYTCLFVCL